MMRSANRITPNGGKLMVGQGYAADPQQMYRVSRTPSRVHRALQIRRQPNSRRWQMDKCLYLNWNTYNPAKRSDPDPNIPDTHQGVWHEGRFPHVSSPMYELRKDLGNEPTKADFRED